MHELSEPVITVKQDVDEDVRVTCRSCKRLTRHEIKISVESFSADYFDEKHEKFEYFESDSFQIIICMGCRTPSFRHYSVTEHDRHPHTGEWEGSESIYPETLAGRGTVKGAGFLPSVVKQIYLETLKALNSNQPILAGIGLRALVEAVCEEEGVAAKNLQKKIDGLVTKDKLTQDDANVLHHIRALGNEAAHEAKPHSIGKLSRALDIVEYLLQGVYIFPRSTKYGILE